MQPHSFARLGPALARWAAVVLLVTGLAGLPVDAAGGAAGAGGALSLISQPDWVRSLPSSIALRLAVQSTLPPSALSVTLALYPRLTSRSAFVETLANNEGVNQPDCVDHVPLSALGLVESTATVTLTPQLTTDRCAGGGTRAGSPYLGLLCEPTTCDEGVYPLVVQLVTSASAHVLATFTTYLVYIPTGSVTGPRLEVAVVLPLGDDSTALRPGGAPDLSAPTLSSLDKELAALGAEGSTALSVSLSPETVEALAHSPGSSAQRILRRLTALATSQSRQVLGAPFAPVDPVALGAAGLTSGYPAQIREGKLVMGRVLGITPALDPYVATSTVDARALELLESAGVDHLVVSGASLQALPLVYTPTAPFRLTVGARSGSSATPAEAFLADPGLADHFAAAGHEPALAAHQFLADVAEIYFDNPDAPDPRGVVVAPRTLLSDSQGLHFLRAVLGGLASSPLADPVTLGQTFASVPVGANDGTITLNARAWTILSKVSVNTSLSAHPIMTAWNQLAALRSFAPRATTLAAQLNESILAAEGTSLTAAQRADYAGAVAHAILAEGRLVSIAPGRSFTLTAPSGQIPITIFSSGNGLRVELTVRSSDLSVKVVARGTDRQLPPGTEGCARSESCSASTIALTRQNNPEVLAVTARTSGDFGLHLELITPTGAIPLYSETITVRSRAISTVALALSSGALALLLLWWVGSLRKRRAAARENAPTPPAAVP